MTYRLQFADSITTESGVRRQNLAETLPRTRRSWRSPSRPGAAFLRRLAIARPDLRPRIAPYLDTGATVSAELLQPLILHGGAWEKTADWIGTYGDLDQLLAWKYLTSDLRDGDTSSRTGCVPSLASRRLPARARPRDPHGRDAAGRYTNAIEVFYVIDYGVSEATDESGNSSATARAGVRQHHYVPGVGPVRATSASCRATGRTGSTGLRRDPVPARSTGLTS